MIVTCPNCSKSYSLDESRIPERGAIGKCRECGHRFRIERKQASPVAPGPASEEIRGAGDEHAPPGGDLGRSDHPDYGTSPAETGEDWLEAKSQPHAVQSDKVRVSKEMASRGTGTAGDCGAGFQETNGFSIGEAMRFGWSTTKKNLGFLILLWIIAIMISLIPNMGERLVSESRLSFFAFGLIGLAVKALVALGMAAVNLEFVDRKEASFDDFFSCFHLIFKYIFSLILLLLMNLAAIIPIVAAGTLFSLVADVFYSGAPFIPVIIGMPVLVWLFLKFGFFGYVIVDEEAGPIEALKRSSFITRGEKWDLLLFLLVIVGINIIGALALFIGLLVTIPVSWLAFAHIYRRLSRKGKAEMSEKWKDAGADWLDTGA